jgi:hypothetical protein
VGGRGSDVAVVELLQRNWLFLNPRPAFRVYFKDGETMKRTLMALMLVFVAGEVTPQQSDLMMEVISVDRCIGAGLCLHYC